MFYEAGDQVRITGDGLLRLSKDAPDDFRQLQALETRRGRLLHVENSDTADVATVEFAPDLAITVPFESIVHETEKDRPEAEDGCPATPGAVVHIQGDELTPGYGAAMSGPVSEASRLAMQRFERNGHRIQQANLALNVISIFAGVRYRRSEETDPVLAEHWSRSEVEFSAEETALYNAALQRLTDYVRDDFEEDSPGDGGLDEVE